MYRKLLIGVLIIFVTGCGFINEKRSIVIRDRGEDYLTSELVSPLEVPVPLTHYSSHGFPIPDEVPDRTQLTAVSIEPPGFGETL